MLLDLDNLSGATNHNGGALHFGPDGKLYVAVGENANGANAQTLSNLLGKMLRINADGTHPDRQSVLQPRPPASNRAIWALGLRNPFTFASSRHRPDVHQRRGQNTWEEIDDGIAGANYGWPDDRRHDDQPELPRAALRLRPGTGLSRLRDHRRCLLHRPSRRFPPATSAITSSPTTAAAGSTGIDVRYRCGLMTFASGISDPVDLKVGPDGSLYYLARGSNSVYQGVVHQLHGRNAHGRRQHRSRGSHHRIAPTGQPAADPVRAAGNDYLD